ncbi:hypothetical protein AB0O07_07725 [Streptomyces sp. NPDC093085]|uniref:COG4315 family predicted lipoprotein n=1 Tax=Streptomyces sp. NPDC093085 TaxID=3155068 RepID=UPI0034385229
MKCNTRSVAAMAAAVLCAAALAGCSGSNATEEAPAEAAASASMSGEMSPSPTGSMGLAKVSARDVAPYGKILVNGEERTLYVFEADKDKESTCLDECVKTWRPLTVTDDNEPKAGSGGVKQDLLSTITRTDNLKQVTYDGHPLYTNKLDHNPGETHGQDKTEFGAKWYVIDPEGKPVTTPPPSGSASPSSTKSPGESASPSGEMSAEPTATG